AIPAPGSTPALRLERHLQPDAVTHRDAADREPVRIAAVGREGVALDAEHPEAEPLIEPEDVEIGCWQSSDEAVSGVVPHPGRRPRHQSGSQTPAAVASEDDQAAELVDPL